MKTSPLAAAFRFLIGLLLLPLCFAATSAALRLLAGIQPSAWTVSPSALALAAGFCLWVFLFFTLPRPTRAYVLGHELTHALWAWLLLGAKVRNLRVSANQGSVTVTKNNFLVTLAPYFFPFYTVLVALLYAGLSLFLDLEAYTLVWLGVIGVTWGFHITFTLNSLAHGQSDVELYGAFFSYTIIYLLNLLGICLGIVWVSSATFLQLARLLGQETRDTVLRLLDWAGQGADALHTLFF